MSETELKLWIMKKVCLITVVFILSGLIIIESVLLIGISLNANSTSTIKNETIESTSLNPISSSTTERKPNESTSWAYKNISFLIPTTTNAPQKDQCPSSSLIGRASGHAALQILDSYRGVTGYRDYEIISREKWNASVYEYESIKLEIPEYVIVSHTLQQQCIYLKQCANSVQTLQKFDRTERNLDDIRYNFLIGGDGSIFEGRGWNVAGQHTDNFDNRSLGIAFIMDSNKDMVEYKQGEALRWLLNEGVKNKKLSEDYKLIGQCQVVYSTDSPGNYVWAWFIYGNNHWIEDPLKFV